MLADGVDVKTHCALLFRGTGEEIPPGELRAVARLCILVAEDVATTEAREARFCRLVASAK